jgi:lipopolysaccharide export system permease protein
VIILRYLGKEIYKTMFFTVAILLLILVTNQLVNLLNRAAMGRMPPMTVVQAVMLGIPQYLTYMIPLGIFLGIIVVMGKLSANHELVSMHAAGFSKRQLLRSIMLIALPVFIFVGLLTFELAPLSSNLERAVLRQAVMSASLDKVIPGQFQPLAGAESVFHAESKTDKTLHNVLLVEPVKKSKANHLPAPIWDITRAKAANQQAINEADFLVFHEGRRVVMQAGSLSGEEFWFKEYGVHTPVPTLENNSRAVSLSTADLRQRMGHNLRYIAEWQWRFAIPISVLVFTLIAFPLSRVQPRQGKFMRVFPAVLIYALYVSLLFCSRSWIKAATVPTWVGMWWVPVLAVTLVLGFFAHVYAKARRMRKRHD